MRTLFSGEVFVAYSQIYVESGDGLSLDLTTFGGQSNGLCGAARPGGLFLFTGLHTGEVAFTVELHESTPPVDDSWEDIVEVSFTPADSEVLLVEWGGEDSWPLELEQIPYRVRYSATGMDAGAEMDTPGEDEPGPDRYLLQFWPEAPRPDTVVKQTSEQAAYWHDVARRLPPPAPEAERFAPTLLSRPRTL